ncbi:MAG: response regulator transcription factor [Rhizobacter sp.]
MRLLIIDDHPIMRFGVAQLLAKAWPDATIDEAARLDEGVTRFNENRPDLVILDLSLPDASGIEGATRMLRIANGVPILVLSLNAESTYATRLLQMGVSGYLPKDRAGEELVSAVQRVLQGRRYVTSAMADRLLGLLEGKSPDQLPHESLAAQEHRVMLLIAAGKMPAEIAELMNLSVKTVGTYRARIFEKTGWKNNTELTKYCVQHGLTDPN